MDTFPNTPRPGTFPGGDTPPGTTAATSRAMPGCEPIDGRDDRSLGDLLKQLRDESGVLLRQEVALAKTELSEKAAKAGKDIASIAIGGGVALIGALALVSAIAYALAALLHLGMKFEWPNALWIAWGLVGIALGITGYVLLNRGLSDLKRQSPVPEKTVQSLQEDKQWLANKTH